MGLIPNKKLYFISVILVIALLQNLAWGSQGPTQNVPHPLDPLSQAEISEVSALIKTAQPGVAWMFIDITLQEPEKSVLLPYFLRDMDPLPNAIPRKAFVVLINPVNGTTYEATVNLNTKILEKWESMPIGTDPTFAADEMAYIAEIVKDDPLVQERLSLYGEFYSNRSNIITDVWKYGFSADKPEFESKRISQVFLYGRNYEHDNFYVHPMGFVVIVDALRREVLEIEEIPIQSDFDTTNREGDEVPTAEGNYDPSISGRLYRTDVSGIDIVQENGPSFTIEDNVLRWQKFKMRIGRNGREGLVLHHVNYNDSGIIRPILYRASVSELFVPYGDPRPPYHRKMALDVGEYGLGFSASELRSPDGCRGSVYFMDSVSNDMAGQPWTVPNTVCIYEEDAGILWRKMDPVTRRILTARSQRLVLTFIATVSNYDYQIKWMFYQDASIRQEMILTGIISQNLMGTGATPGGHGTIVMEHINAQFHQHFFAVRLDAEIDGNLNTVSVVDVVPDEEVSGSPTHPYGNGFHVNESVLRTPSEARTNTRPESARTWKVFGETINPITGGPRGWKLIPDNAARLMMSKDSVMHPGKAFTDYEVWVTKYQENQLFAAGYYLNNSGLPEWIENDPDADIVNEDIVLWHVYGVTHVPRTEDAPVMPVESIGFWFKPANFFTENPSVDVLPIVRESEKVRRTG